MVPGKKKGAVTAVKIVLHSLGVIAEVKDVLQIGPHDGTRLLLTSHPGEANDGS